MIVNPTVSNLWLAPLAGQAGLVAQALSLVAPRLPDEVTVFFRADDIGAPGHNFSRMAEIFLKHELPLNLAVVPAWLTKPRFSALYGEAGNDELFCWCQHGYRHANHEPQGKKKREFGPARSAEDKRKDLERGLLRLKDMLDGKLCPVFSPPWNRCDAESMQAMADLGFKAVSRTVGAAPAPVDSLPDFPVRVDLHTRKEANPEESMQCLLGELEESLESGSCGIMLHHQRMNPAAFEFLDLLLGELKKLPQLKFLNFSQMLAA